MSYKFKDHDKDESHVDWDKIFNGKPEWDAAAQDFCLPLNPAEMDVVERIGNVMLEFRFREHPELPLAMQREQDRAFQAYCQKQFAYTEPHP